MYMFKSKIGENDGKKVFKGRYNSSLLTGIFHQLFWVTLCGETFVKCVPLLAKVRLFAPHYA